MRDENDLNAHLSRRFKKLAPETYSIKLAEKYHEGIADFQFVRGGRTAFVEVKLLREPPGPRARRVLKHEFSGPQLTFLGSAAAAGAACFGLIGLDFDSLLRVVRHDLIPRAGNWAPAEWAVSKDFTTFHLDDYQRLVDHFFNVDAP